jgi:hypothetical protein
MNQQDILFYPVICTYVAQYNKAEDAYIKRKLKEGLKDTLKKWTDQPVNMVSKDVFDACTSNKIDPFSLLWPKKDILGKVNGKSLLLWEHTTPLEELFKELVDAKTEVAIKAVMLSYSGVCWIMRHEDDALNRAGYKSKRPGGWQKCYEECVSPLVYRK